MAQIIDGKQIAADVRRTLAGEVAALAAAGQVPGLAVILVGEDPASQTYVRNKQRACAEVGIRSVQIDLPADKLSGLKQAVRVLKNVEGIGICELTDQDVVRHVMVQRIIKAYADYEDARNEKRKR